MIFCGLTYLTEEQKATVSSTALDKAVYVFDPSKHLIEIRHYESQARDSA